MGKVVASGLQIPFLPGYELRTAPQRSQSAPGALMCYNHSNALGTTFPTASGAIAASPQFKARSDLRSRR